MIITIYLFAAIERVQRPGGSHEGVGGRKSPLLSPSPERLWCWSVVPRIPLCCLRTGTALKGRINRNRVPSREWCLKLREGSPKHKRQTAWCEGSAPHRPKPLLPYSTLTKEKGKLDLQTASNKHEVVRTGQTPKPLPKQSISIRTGSGGTNKIHKESEGAGDLWRFLPLTKKSTTDGEDTSDDADSDELKWCPPNSNAQDDHRRKTGWGCRKLDTMMAKVQPSLNIFFTPDSCISQLLLREVCWTFPDLWERRQHWPLLLGDC